MIDQSEHGSKGKKSKKGKIPDDESKQQQGLGNDEQPDRAFAKMIENAHQLVWVSGDYQNDFSFYFFRLKVEQNFIQGAVNSFFKHFC